MINVSARQTMWFRVQSGILSAGYEKTLKQL